MASKAVRNRVGKLRTVCLCLMIGLVSGAAGCAEEVGRIALPGSETKRLTLDLDATKEVDFWVELDVKYKGELMLGFEILLEQQGAKVAEAHCNALTPSTKVMSAETNFNGSHSKRYRGKMRCSVEVPKSGPTTVVVQPIAQPRPPELLKFELVVKQ